MITASFFVFLFVVMAIALVGLLIWLVYDAIRCGDGPLYLQQTLWFSFQFAVMLGGTIALEEAVRWCCYDPATSLALFRVLVVGGVLLAGLATIAVNLGVDWVRDRRRSKAARVDIVFQESADDVLPLRPSGDSVPRLPDDF